ncbi:hypothetical protein [Elizabethkingia ursingii]|uniref:hypothetical protein n=1 Tax=Elizabethkingia ursingii TaxID=1756150 RepID=UPI000ABFC19E|nr:hypothetical protein [Elizabethkingia ursingii]
MRTIDTVKAEIQKEIDLTLEFFAEVDRKEVERKELEERLKSTPEEKESLEALFNELTK